MRPVGLCFHLVFCSFHTESLLLLKAVSDFTVFKTNLTLDLNIFKPHLRMFVIKCKGITEHSSLLTLVKPDLTGSYTFPIRI